MHTCHRTTPVVLSATLLSLFALAFMTVDQRCVAGPGFICFVVVLWLWMTLWDRDGKIPFFDAGMFSALATLIYTVYPLINYWAGGLQFGLLSDFRLASYYISPLELGVFHLRHVLYLFFMVAFYSMFRGSGSIETGNVDSPSNSARNIIVLFFVVFTAYFLTLELMTGTNFNAGYASESFAQNVVVFASLPLLLLQVSFKLTGILFLFKLGLLFIVISRCRQKMWVNILLLWIVVEIVQALYIKGARTNLVMFFVAAALLYHRIIKPFSMKFLVSAGAFLLLLFTFIGTYRSYISIADMQSDMSSNIDMFIRGNEFQSLLGTEYDMLQRKLSGVVLPWYLYINDFATILPPQQLIPFEKISAAEWYLREMGISGTGYGYMWGVITQSIVGWDWIELIFRGAILGYVLARLHRWYLKYQKNFLGTLFYTYLCLKVYYAFRDTTGSLLSSLVWVVLPVYLLLSIGKAKFGRSEVVRTL